MTPAWDGALYLGSYKIPIEEGCYGEELSKLSGYVQFAWAGYQCGLV